MYINKEYLTVDEAANLLGITKKTLYVWTSNRKVPFYKVSKHLKFSRKDLIDFIESQKVDVRKEAA